MVRVLYESGTLYVVQKQDNTAQTVVWPPPKQPPCEKASERSEALRELDVVGHTAKASRLPSEAVVV
jgi:hypothetical protein